MNIDCIIGIDPGSNGSIAVWRPDTKVTTIPMPEDIFSLREYFQHLKSISKNILCLIEKVQTRPDDMQFGKATQIQKLLAGFQQLKDVLTIEDIPFVQVHPATWQSSLNLRAKFENPDDVEAAVQATLEKRLKAKKRTNNSELAEIRERAIKRVRKNRYCRAAQKFYPEIKATLINSDALLLVHFGRTKLEYDPQWLIERLPEKIQPKIRF